MKNVCVFVKPLRQGNVLILLQTVNALIFIVQKQIDQTNTGIEI